MFYIMLNLICFMIIEKSYEKQIGLSYCFIISLEIQSPVLNTW